jgi:hypothetical protein
MKKYLFILIAYNIGLPTASSQSVELSRSQEVNYYLNERNLCVDEYNECQNQLTWCDSAVYHYSKACFSKDSIIEKSVEIISICNEDTWQLSNELANEKRKGKFKNYALFASLGIIIGLALIAFL